jgi:hypothetical protein
VARRVCVMRANRIANGVRWEAKTREILLEADAKEKEEMEEGNGHFPT